MTLTPTIDSKACAGDLAPKPTPCRVIFVHPRKNFFTVRFEGLGFCETFFMGPRCGKLSEKKH